MSKKILRNIIVVLTIALLVAAAAGCSQQPTAEQQPQDGGTSEDPKQAQAKIGMVGPLTGNTASYGVSTKNGVEVAIAMVNEEGGINGQDVLLLPEDTRGDQTEAANATRKLVEQDKVHAIVGAVLSSETFSGAPIANDAKVSMISSSSTAPGVPEIGPYIFRNCIADDVQAAQLAEYAVNDMGYKNFAIMYTNNDYGMALKNAFEAKANEIATVVAVEAYTDGDANFSAQLTKIKSKSPDALYIGGYYTEASKIAQQAQEQGLNVQILGGDGFYSTKLTELGGQAVEGAVFTAGFFSGDTTENVQNFIAKYKEMFDGAEPDMFAAQAYDAAMIVLEAMKKAGIESTALRDAIAATKGFPGITGVTDFTENGDAVKDILILKVENGDFIRIR
jgi:branched-chain amino acid transport system substrate-binding protein